MPDTAEDDDVGVVVVETELEGAAEEEDVGVAIVAETKLECVVEVKELVDKEMGTLDDSDVDECASSDKVNESLDPLDSSHGS